MIILCFLVFLSNFKLVNFIIRELDIFDRKKDKCWCYVNVYFIIWSEFFNIVSNFY